MCSEHGLNSYVLQLHIPFYFLTFLVVREAENEVELVLEQWVDMKAEIKRSLGLS